MPSRQETITRFGRNLLAVVSLTAAFGTSSAASQPSSPEHQPGPTDCGSCLLGADQAQMLGRQAAIGLQPNSIGQNTSQPVMEPHLSIGSEDDSAVASANQARIATATKQARSMGDTSWRDILYPKDVLKQRWGRYDLSVSNAINEGLDVNITLACNDEHWTDSQFKRYVSSAVQRYDKLGVRNYSICNEPNFPGWLNPMPGKTLPQTYRSLYTDGYSAVKQQAQKDGVNDQVSIFELSSEIWPLKFIKQTLACPPPKSSTCTPLLANEVAYHPYSLTTPPTQPSKTPGEVGMGSLVLLENLVKSEYDAGRLETPDGQEPKLGLDEFAYQVKTSKDAARKHGRALPDSVRREYYREDLQIACLDPNIVRIIFYGLESPPPHSQGTWNSALIRPGGAPYGSLYVIQSFAIDHPDCVIR